MQQSILQDLLSVFTEEQLKQVAEIAKRMRDRAKERKREQSLSVVFSSGGHPRTIDGTDNAPIIWKGQFE